MRWVRFRGSCAAMAMGAMGVEVEAVSVVASKVDSGVQWVRFRGSYTSVALGSRLK